MKLCIIQEILIVLCLSANGVFALTCLQCEGISQPRHCRKATQCGPDAQCVTERVLNSFGEYVYNLGCLHNTECSRQTHDAFSTCAECCSTDLCNAAGCGQPDYPSIRGPICYSCPVYSDVARCHNIDFCAVSEVCSLNGRLEFSDMVFSSGCSEATDCGDVTVDPSLSVGRKRAHQQSACNTCCTSDLCNNVCNVTLPTASPPPIVTRTTTMTYPTSTTSLMNTTIATAFQDCQEILDAGMSTGDGLYWTTWNGTQSQVFCDMTTDGGGWTVFQYRFDGSVDFYRNFSDYQQGFGQYPGEFWQGLDWLSWITNSKTYSLRVDLTAPNGTRGYATYQTFAVTAPTRYAINITGYSGSIGDKLDRQKGQAFSTFDKDQDGYGTGTNCAVDYHGAWWYETCFDSNLNGGYAPGSADHAKMVWAYWPNDSDFYYGLKGSRMAIRPA